MQIPPGWELPESIRVRLGERSGKQRAMIEEGHLLLILHKLPEHDSPDREGVFFWRTPEGEWRYSGGGNGLPALKEHIARYDERADKLEQAYESSQNATGLFRVLESAVPLHRAAKNMHAALQAAREGLPEATEIINLRDAAADVDRATELLEIDAKNALDYRIARQSEEQASLSYEMTKAGHRLNFLAAIFLPLTAVASVFGMGLPNGLENSPTWVFWSVFAFGVLLGIVLRSWLLRGNDAPRR
jgi:Mg2+ and Co2+ transporter CorA